MGDHVKYIKKAIPVQVEFAVDAGAIETLEGSVTYSPGDALMTGAIGEHWPIKRARFEATYDAVPPTLMGSAGAYLKKPIPVDARQIHVEEKILLPERQGILLARAGDWVLTDPDGHQWVVANDIFAATYQTVES